MRQIVAVIFWIGPGCYALLFVPQGAGRLAQEER
jgi:hypothetical protein